MTMQNVNIRLPEELVAIFESPEEAASKAVELLVIELLREARISEGKAAELLGISRWDMMRLASEHNVPFGAATKEELLAEVANVKQRMREITTRDHNQR